MADIRKRGPYQWQVRVRKKGYPSQTRTFNTKAEAEAWAATTESEMTRGIFVSRKEAENTTLSEAIERYISEVIPTKKQQRREKNRAIALQKFSLAKYSLASIQGKEIAAFRDMREKGGVGPNTIRLDLALISHLFSTAIKEWGMTGLINPVQQIRKPKLPRGRDRRIRHGELERIIKASESPLLGELIRFALETAMRRSELAGMVWNLVDLKKRTVTLPETKNGEKRIVPLSPEAVRILEGIPRRLDGDVWGMEPDSITQAFLRAVTRARGAYEKEFEENHKGEKGAKPDPAFLVDLTFHDLRHEATSRLFELGLSTEKVKEITGHKTYQMLARYTHLKAEDIADEIDTLKRIKNERKNDFRSKSTI
jgi:integrase